MVQVPAFAESVSEGDVRFEKAAGDAVKEDEVGGRPWDVMLDADATATVSMPSGHMGGIGYERCDIASSSYIG